MIAIGRTTMLGKDLLLSRVTFLSFVLASLINTDLRRYERQRVKDRAAISLGEVVSKVRIHARGEGEGSMRSIAILYEQQTKEESNTEPQQESAKTTHHRKTSRKIHVFYPLLSSFFFWGSDP